MILATEKFLPYDKQINSYVVDRMMDLKAESDREAEARHLERNERFEFRKNYIKNYVIEHDPL
jgi:hypothetical protein